MSSHTRTLPARQAQLPDSGFRTVRVRELDFRVFEQGKGTPLLLLHGFPDCLEVWASMVPLLVAAGYRVIAYDQRGFGESDAPRGVGQYGIDPIVADAVALLDSLGVREPVCLMGHDWGAAIAWCFTLAHPERVRAQVVVSVGHPKSYGRAGFRQKVVKGGYVLWFQLRILSEWYLLHAGGLRRWLAGGNELSQVMERMSRPGRLTAALSWYRANLLRVLAGDWPAAQRPTLGIWSAGDAYLVEEQMKNSQRYVASAWDYRRIENCGHWIPLEQPRLMADLAIAWFGRHTGECSHSPELFKREPGLLTEAEEPMPRIQSDSGIR